MAIEVLIPNRIKRERSLGWRKPVGSVIVDRTSRWGNPWSVVMRPETGSWYVCRASNQRRVGHWHRHRSAAILSAIGYFRRYLTMTPRGRGLVASSAKELSGKNLVCWCRFDEPCHADVLLRTARGDTP